MKTLAIVLARGGSKGILKKNIRLLAGKPLIVYSIEAALKSKYIDKVVVSTEDTEIAKIAKKHNVEVIERPRELALDDTPSLPVLKHSIKFLEDNRGYRANVVVVLQPTSPLRKVSDIDKCIEKLVKEKCDSIITLRKVEHPPHWMVKLDMQDRIREFFKLDKIDRRQDIPDIYIPNGAVFVTWQNTITKHNTIRGPDTRGVLMPQERSLDIDTELDFLIAEKLIEREKNKK